MYCTNCVHLSTFEEVDAYRAQALYDFLSIVMFLYVLGFKCQPLFFIRKFPIYQKATLLFFFIFSLEFVSFVR